MENKHKQFSDKNYIFFVRRTTPANPTTGEINSYENYCKGGTDRRNCWLIDWDADFVDKFTPEVYPYIECVYAPVDGKYSLEEMNAKLLPAGKQLTKEEKLEKRIAELEQAAKETAPKKQYTRKTK